MGTVNWKVELQSLIDSIVTAEGGTEELVKAVRCSVPNVRDYEEARRITENTIFHALWDSAMQDRDSFIQFLGSRWAPIGAANDPHNLNKNWVKNVLSLWPQ